VGDDAGPVYRSRLARQLAAFAIDGRRRTPDHDHRLVVFFTGLLTVAYSSPGPVHLAYGVVIALGVLVVSYLASFALARQYDGQTETTVLAAGLAAELAFLILYLPLARPYTGIELVHRNSHRSPNHDPENQTQIYRRVPRAVEPEKRCRLEKLRRTIQAAAPKAVECIAWQLPCFRLDGKLLVAFGAAKNHCSFYPMSSRPWPPTSATSKPTTPPKAPSTSSRTSPPGRPRPQAGKSPHRGA